MTAERFLFSSLLWGALGLGIGGLSVGAPAYGQQPRIVITAVTDDACHTQDVRGLLLATGRFAAVDILDITQFNPLLVDYQLYDAALVWNNDIFYDADGLGDVLADYVDSGGGVVVAMMAPSMPLLGRYIGGRWHAEDYEVLQGQGGITTTASDLGLVLQPSHPVMAGVTNLHADWAYRPTLTTLEQGSVVATWADGKILVAEGDMPGRVDLGLMPPSNSCNTVFWDINGDGARLMANALEYVADGPSLFDTFCDPADVNSTGQPTVLSALRSRQASSGLHLQVAQGPPGQFGYLIASDGQSAPGMALGQGHLCVGGGGSQVFAYKAPGGPGNSVGRFDGAGVLQNLVGTSSSGAGFDVPMGLPGLMGNLQAGQSYHFQLWHRDQGGAFNFSNGVSATF